MGDQKLRDGTAAIVRNEIRLPDIQRVHQADDHAHLVKWADALPLGDLGVAHGEKVGRDAAPKRRQPLNRVPPLEAV